MTRSMNQSLEHGIRPTIPGSFRTGMMFNVTVGRYPVIFVKYHPNAATTEHNYYLCYDIYHAYPKPYLDWWSNISCSNYVGVAPLSYMLCMLYALQKEKLIDQ